MINQQITYWNINTYRLWKSIILKISVKVFEIQSKCCQLFKNKTILINWIFTGVTRNSWNFVNSFLSGMPQIDEIWLNNKLRSWGYEKKGLQRTRRKLGPHKGHFVSKREPYYDKLQLKQLRLYGRLFEKVNFISSDIMKLVFTKSTSGTQVLFIEITLNSISLVEVAVTLSENIPFPRLR